MDITKATTEGLWYFAHPYTRKDAEGRYVPAAEAANFQLACVRSGELIRRGFNIYSPIAHTHPIHCACPSLLAANEHELWYHLDNEVIDAVRWKGVILAPEWETSNGCRAERDRILAQGGTVMLYQTAIENYPTLRI
jgi:hypothetical protein